MRPHPKPGRWRQPVTGSTGRVRPAEPTLLPPPRLRLREERAGELQRRPAQGQAGQREEATALRRSSQRGLAAGAARAGRPAEQASRAQAGGAGAPVRTLDRLRGRQIRAGRAPPRRRPARPRRWRAAPREAPAAPPAAAMARRSSDRGDRGRVAREARDGWRPGPGGSPVPAPSSFRKPSAKPVRNVPRPKPEEDKACRAGAQGLTAPESRPAPRRPPAPRGPGPGPSFAIRSPSVFGCSQRLDSRPRPQPRPHPHHVAAAAESEGRPRGRRPQGQQRPPAAGSARTFCGRGPSWPRPRAGASLPKGRPKEAGRAALGRGLHPSRK